MENDKTQNVANETEVPVGAVPNIANSETSNPKKSPLEVIKNIPVKFLAIGGVVVIILIVTISVFFLMGKSPINQEYAQLNEQAREAISNGDYDTAEELINQGYESTGGNPEFAAQKISLLAIKGNQNGTEQESLEEARQYIESSLKEAPNNPNVLRASGYAYETAGEYEKALELYDNALSQNPNSSDLHFHRGHVLYFLGRFEEGQEAYRKSIELDANNSSTLIALGNIAVIEGDLDNAVDLFMKAFQNSKTNQLKAEALTAASIVKRRQFKMSEAIDLGKQSVAIDPNFSTGLGNYGYTLYINGSAQEGADYINKAIEINPRISKNYDYAASVLRIDGQYDEAISYQNQAIQRVSDDNTLFGNEAKIEMRAIYTYNLAKIYSTSGGNTDTLILLQQAISIKPDLKEALVSDSQNGLFAELAENAQFQALLS